MAGSVFEHGDLRDKDEDYIDTAGHLLTQCLSLITDCLQQVSAIHSSGIMLSCTSCISTGLNVEMLSHKAMNFPEASNRHMIYHSQLLSYIVAQQSHGPSFHWVVTKYLLQLC